MQSIASEAPTLIKGLGVIVGEIVVGVNGPFLFERFGLNTPEAILGGVLVGAALGFCSAVIGLAVHHRQPAPKVHGVRAHVHAHRV